MDKFIEIPEYATEAIGKLNAGGFEAFVVGGCVRDSLMGRTPSDWDITTSAFPEETKAVFKDYRTIDTGIKHGTVTVLIGGEQVEITTYRSDGEYPDHRRPESVDFSRNLSDDLSRRDFTVNAMAYNDNNGLIDMFGGLEDLNRRVLRCVGEPETRFNEDALRILRCLRFASVLDFGIEINTELAARKLKESLSFISAERINQEFSKLICGERAHQVIGNFRDVIAVFIPELEDIYDLPQNCPYHCFDVWQHSLEALRNTPEDKELRLAVLLHDLGKGSTKTSKDGFDHFYSHEKTSAEKADEILRRLKYDNTSRENICMLIKHHMEPLPMPEIRVKRLMMKLGDELFEKLLLVERADNMAIKPEYIHGRMEQIAEAKATAEKIRAADECLSLKKLKIKGNDLMDLGYPVGKAIGNELNSLLDSVISGELENDPEILISRAEADLKSV